MRSYHPYNDEVTILLDLMKHQQYNTYDNRDILRDLISKYATYYRYINPQIPMECVDELLLFQSALHGYMMKVFEYGFNGFWDKMCTEGDRPFRAGDFVRLVNKALEQYEFKYWSVRLCYDLSTIEVFLNITEFDLIDHAFHSWDIKPQLNCVDMLFTITH